MPLSPVKLRGVAPVVLVVVRLAHEAAELEQVVERGHGLGDVLVAGGGQPGHHLQHLQHAPRVGELDHRGVLAVGVEVVTEVEQRILAREAVLEYLLEVELGARIVGHLAEAPGLQGRQVCAGGGLHAAPGAPLQVPAAEGEMGTQNIPVLE